LAGLPLAGKLLLDSYITSKRKGVTCLYYLQISFWLLLSKDENGEFRNPSCDGFDNNQFESSIEEHLDSLSQSNASEDTDILMHLRLKLSNLYPHQSYELNKCLLLHSTTNPYPDTNSNNTLLRAHQLLVRLRTMDTILQNAQRQGRISFYLTCTGEEAIHMGAASALTNQDPIFAQYREQGLLMWRGFTLEQFTNQCFSNDRDLGKGRQMPIHYGSRALNYHTVSSPLGTQLPQAVGAAYRLKLMKKPNVAICFFGDGCSSTTDFHAALNFAATLSAPVLFFCRNNGYAISTPVTDQYAGDGIVSRAVGYGMAAIRVDGNDIFAVHAAVREAKKYALLHNAPVLIEGMTYRLGHHSTSDDSTRYRSDDEVVDFADKMDPLVRLNLFLQRHNLITENEINTMKDEERLAVLDAIKLAEKRPKPSIDSMFEDVYKDMPMHLKKQLEELKQHVAKHQDKY
jgi:2-oxoisovalerate dehydrogenase E1 component alpha subunit